ncbi:MAG TPA: HNH endonuclease signature motif containing protein, partial [Acidimicrobiales bacterium]
MFVDELEEAVGQGRSLLLASKRERLSPADARRVVELFAEFERIGSSGVAMLSPQVVADGSFAKEGHGTGAEWLGSVVGTSPSAARKILKAGKAAAASPALQEALAAGTLSQAQFEKVADAASIAPDGEERLLSMVGRASHAELADEVSKMRAEARCREAAHERRSRVHRMRHLRWRQDPHGGIRFEGHCDEVGWAKVMPSLEGRALALQKAAHRAGSDEPLEAFRMDALLNLLSQGGVGSAPSVLVLVDAESLRQGSMVPGGTCEIDGIGVVSVEAATELLGEGNVQFIVKDGVDIRTVTSATRAIPRRVELALIARDRVCAVPGCGARFGLQIDHRDTDFSDGGPTEIENLVRLCRSHHDLKTYGGFRLEGEAPDWKWIPP